MMVIASSHVKANCSSLKKFCELWCRWFFFSPKFETFDTFQGHTWKKKREKNKEWELEKKRKKLKKGELKKGWIWGMFSSARNSAEKVKYGKLWWRVRHQHLGVILLKRWVSHSLLKALSPSASSISFSNQSKEKSWEFQAIKEELVN